MTDDREAQLLALLTRDAEVWHQRQREMHMGGSNVTPVLSGGDGETALRETWGERKARREIERKNTIAKAAAKLEVVKLSVLRRGTRASVNRMKAIASGARTYMGAKCKRGHSGLRLVDKSSCVECERLRWKGQSRRARAVTRSKRFGKLSMSMSMSVKTKA